MERTAAPNATVAQRYDLGQLAETLTATYPIERLYLFGSRRHRTRSARSDVDVLVEASEHIRPSELRGFATAHCRALDLFILDDRKATSCQNGSYVEAPTKADLLAKLDAVEFWCRSQGRLAADIDWTFELLPNVAYRPTEIVGANQIASEDPSTWTIGQIVQRLRAAHVWRVLGIAFTLVAGAFSAGTYVGRNLLSGEAATPVLQPLDEGRPHKQKAGAEAKPKRVGEVTGIELHGPIDADKFEESMRDLRKDRNLRRLTATESGHPLKEIPFGTYFFVYPNKNLGAHDAHRYRDLDELYFEAHAVHREDPSLMAFVSETDFARLGMLDDTYSENITFFPIPVGEAINLVSVPFSRFDAVRQREAEFGPRQSVYVLDATVR